MSKTATKSTDRYDELGIDRYALTDCGTAPWDAIERPAKGVEAYATGEVERECVRLAAVFLSRSGFEDVEASPVAGADLRATDTRGERPEDVLIAVRAGRDLEGDGLDMPGLNVTTQQGRDLRWSLSSLAQWCGCDRGRYRADVMAVAIVGQRVAKLRHLTGAAWLDLA
ncbi:hypothetical protein QJ043_06995 [Olsenella sp. YH-ols2217]|uniref:Uncharacterized protein n=1 Tax=Kribbibacterium absianum TaxID=3044210 RepID=A0ABT6ZLB0_9ACTN|nr:MULTISPECIES: hypothetical protein [unclassified Olsenella]MDJ1121812.1 hypothetical protein [Olsenella sp. YH-ols2216]MDJ1129820.1 hypothetical protein [Olsenella sp. YH-ols2217]